jgi:coniferyl-aldehyde dehydrogenase
MDQPLKSPRHSALEVTFHAMFDASRADPAPACDVRIDRLRRLRALVSDNETRFEQARQNILSRHALAP